MTLHTRERNARIASDLVFAEALKAGESFADANDYSFAVEAYASATPQARPVRDR